MREIFSRRRATMRPTRESIVAQVAQRDPLPPLERREWWRGAALYQVYVRSFRDSSGDGIGDLKGVCEKLDHIQSLGVDGFWLSPINPSPQEDFGYDITDFRAVDAIHGNMSDFDRMVSEAHSRGLKVLLDLIPCHTSDEHQWFKESRRDKDGNFGDWYIWADAAPDGGPPNNWLSSFGGPAWTWEPRRSQYYYHPFLSCQPALNLRKNEVLEAVVDAMHFWLDHGVDGFRLDAIQCLACDADLRSNPPEDSRGPVAPLGGGENNPFRKQAHLYDRDVPGAFPIVERLRKAVEGYEPERVLIGELADTDSARNSEKYTVLGEGLHAVYDFSLIHVSREVRELTEILTYRSAFLRTGWMMNVFSNHDSTRAVTDFTHFAETREQQVAAQKLLFFMQFALKGGGIIYQGEELALPHPELRYEDLRDPWGIAFWPDFEGRDGARTPMPWSSGAPHCGFTEGEPWMRVPPEHCHLSADRQAEDPDSAMRFLRAFLDWRKEQPLLRWGGERVYPPDLAPLIMWERYGGGEDMLCFVNFSANTQTLPAERIGKRQLLDGPGMASEMEKTGVEIPPFGFGCALGSTE
ncbi:alpha-glucosidase [Palleronia marisminoris]|uniref:Oligo-1,6-glucosidase 1 n=1 Tax=Palleronia marisminoris TaxID=315423 RepID=A0A1Y5REL2_9RHOB|nr:alpha-amylase family glycosyl hydrolase [Palleronia marisminoris]SFG15379.1 alpha-glucosidase [Palleronia marisminoris]SLN15639.1 Oligo-1,6-glucosidase 1 [Palleronia marisminoris]